MAIDADLNSGLINETEAKRRRKEIADEADFYGAMDGASKFVKGDAIAAIVIVLINLIGGFAVGILQKHMSFGDAVQQLQPAHRRRRAGRADPGAAHLAVVGSDRDPRRDRERPRHRPAAPVHPAQAHAPARGRRASASSRSCPACRRSRSCSWAGCCSSSRPACPPTSRSSTRPTALEALEPSREPLSPDAPERIATDMRVEPLELEIAFDLVDLVDAEQGRRPARPRARAAAQARARARHRDPPRTHARQHGAARRAPTRSACTASRSAGARRRRTTCSCSATTSPACPAPPTREPVFGLPARWVPLEFRHQAEVTGATVVDRASVITTHLAEVVRRNAGRLLGRQDVKLLIDLVKQTDPVVVDELNGANITAGEIQRVLQSLLDEGVGIRDLVRIFEVVSERSRVDQGPRADRRGGAHRARPRDLRVARARRQAAGARARADHRALARRSAAHQRPRHVPRARPADRRAARRPRSPAARRRPR